MLNRKPKLIVTAVAVAGPLALTLVADSGAQPLQAQVSGGQAQLYPSWTRIDARCSGKRRRVRCRLNGKVTVVNGGNTQSGPCKLDLWVSRNDVLDPAEDEKVQTLDVPSINAEGETDLDFAFSTPRGAKVIRRYVIAVIDPTQLVPESDEADNEEAIGPLR